MTVDPRDLAAHMLPEVTEGRLARQWASLEAKRPRGAAPASARWVWLTSLAVTACGVAGWIWMKAPVPTRGAILESSATPVTMQMGDGTSLELAAQTQLRVLRDQPSAVELELAQGSASFDVKHVERRAFAVHAGAVSVRVVGTKFSVTKVVRPEGQEISVSVQRGVVEVERADRGDSRRLMAGEKWSAWVAAQSDADVRASDVSPTSLSTPETQAADAEAADTAPHRATHPGAAKPPARAGDVTAHRPRRASVRPSEDDESGSAEVDEPEPPAKAASARSLYARATVARRAGLMQEAADAYAELLRGYPQDARAATAAFELGRIRMDALSDPSGAAEAFTDALRLSKRAQFREDALARLAIADHALGRREACRSVRALYLAEFPTGVHAAALSNLCGETRP